MKRHLFIVIIIVFGFIGCQSKKEYAIISGTIIGNIQGEIEYASSENGTCDRQFAKPLTIDSSGHFRLTLDIEDPTFFQILIGTYPQSTIIVEPGLDYEIEFNVDAENDRFTLNCVNNKAQTLYQSLPLDHPQNATFNFIRHKRPIPSNIFDSIQSVKETEILKFRELLDNNEISEPFYELVKADRACYYTAIQSRFASTLYFNAQETGNDSLKTEVLNKWDEILNNCPLNATYAVYSFWFNTLATDLFSKISKEQPATIDSLIKIYNAPYSLSIDVALARMLLDGKAEEYFIASYLQSANNNISKNEELVGLIQEFKNNYPQSEFLPYLDDLQKSMAAFLKVADAPFNDNIKIIDNENINSLEECVSMFKGKQVYIDVWASWCLPCRAEFKHLDNLRTLLSSNDVVLLFISIDDESFIRMWPDLIKFYNLEGFHINANKQLDWDLRHIYSNGGGWMNIPWNILVDEHGQIKQLHASRPSQLDQLEKEIKM